ncbi:hypothetical protein D9758_000573 [Tetrapyrgos nigripes]|uniref:Uncharacterized protein n=1 Tax=Tetrapyrgos nigripes TaxID=182062 RepID=A0A8H5LYC8_9AGAR|nr:hypothetical protein D9758_000573 [Tetrapyrgos nigripes]
MLSLSRYIPYRPRCRIRHNSSLPSFADSAVYPLSVARRFLKYSALGIVFLGSTTAVIFEGTHYWVEHVALKPSEEGDEVRKWEWNLEGERWSTPAGGTDPGLGFKGRHAVRAAWMAWNWDEEHSPAVVTSDAAEANPSLPGPRGAAVMDPRLVRTELSLRAALDVAERKAIEGKLQPTTLPQLLLLHASVLERMGLESSRRARSQYERAWASHPSGQINSARIANKLGDLDFRLGQNDSALSWWYRAIQLSNITPDSTHSPPVFPVPESMPLSPCAQRTLLSTLTSVSAYYATTGQLNEARSLDEHSLNLIRSVRQPESFASASPPHALHALTLLQRSSVFSVHLAEVEYALKNRIPPSLQWLSVAAESSERVARALTGMPIGNSSKAGENHRTFMDKGILASYAQSASMKQPASSLLRDARRTVAESWNLMGILNEPKNLQTALECYERAVKWAGTMDGDGSERPGEGILDRDWQIIFGNYKRLKSKQDDVSSK